MQPVNISVYRPGTVLDDELAGLGYAAMRGWPDQRPVTAALVRSRLRPPGKALPTMLFVSRTASGGLAAAAAVRHSAAPGAPARLWGPVVAPEWQRRGLGTLLLQYVTDYLPGHGVVALTAEIPASREHGCALYERAGWVPHSSAVLLKGPLAPPAHPPVGGVRVRPVGVSDAAALGRLYRAVNPGHGGVVAENTYWRWGSDERFVADGLLGVDGAVGELRAAALVYPLIHASPGEPAEALLADVLVRPGEDRAAVAQPLIAATLAAGIRHDAVVARAVVPAAQRDLLADLRAAGLTAREDIRYYQAPLKSSARREAS
ncbi:GNAT family N-acetyltransferase [Streptosporangium amethystogenes subsp. fukuiense]|uniref:GNAT family N-acetyltransferase n=1 Tax=Streptosporangium amethystogenes subsp. fukuiense TaxID=698418 RepID=A0ABW2SZD6_9ACTN